MWFSRQSPQPTLPSKGFSYLKEGTLYFDSACQTLRPAEVIAATKDYYTNYSACGGRVKYEWGKKVDAHVASSREKMLAYLGRSSKTHVCSFTLNTTNAINSVLQQIDPTTFDTIVTSDIEHNSVFLPTMTLAKRLGKKRVVLERDATGALIYSEQDLTNALVVLNGTSNIDGRSLHNMKALADDIHRNGGLLVIDAAQSLAHDVELLRSSDIDVICGSVHKMYGPSLGVIIAKSSFVSSVQPFWIGGGMVEDVERDQFTLVSDKQELHTRFEAGLQDWAAIIGLEATLDWLNTQKNWHKQEEQLKNELYEMVRSLPGVTIINKQESSVVSFYHERLDSHRLAMYAGEHGLMARSGYFCCHYYLKHKLSLPPLFRLSAGLHLTSDDIQKAKTLLTQILNNA